MRRPFLAGSLLLLVLLGLSSRASWAGPVEDLLCPSIHDGHDRPTFSAYKENYIVTGFTTESQVKFQVSVKAVLFPQLRGCALFFGYTQKSLWDVYSGGSPFEGSDYNPELFFSLANKDLVLDPRNPTLAGWSLLALDVGLFEHESNGQAGPDSRGWNRSYLRARFGYVGDSAFVLLTPKIWVPYWIDQTDNPNIVRYLGYFQLGLELGLEHSLRSFDLPTWRSRYVLGVLARKGWDRDLTIGSLESWLRVRIGPKGSTPYRFGAAAYAQLVTGYGETLAHYNQFETSFRIGLSLGDMPVDSLAAEALIGQ
jgi:phospholipase A1/A2